MQECVLINVYLICVYIYVRVCVYLYRYICRYIHLCAYIYKYLFILQAQNPSLKMGKTKCPLLNENIHFISTWEIPGKDVNPKDAVTIAIQE